MGLDRAIGMWVVVRESNLKDLPDLVAITGISLHGESHYGQ